MKWVVIVVRTLVGALFIFSGVVGLFNLMDAQLPEGDAGTFGKVMMDTGYMRAVKVVELVGGLLLVSGRMAPLGITLLMPVAVNILFFEAFLARQPGLGVILVPLLAFLIWGYRGAFASVFTTDAKIGANTPS